MATKEIARQVVQNIIDAHGFVQEESLKTMRPKVRLEVERALLAKDKKIGSSVLTLAKDLYTSGARLIFELLQNADDNQYTEAKSVGNLPYLSFKVYSDQIVVECNEDGFNETNLSAICDIGKSSKSSSHGYIGAKGIGFKSVSMAAWKVYIQSRNYSFYFIHRKNDSGMGMIMPIWEEPKEDLPGPLTRFTLFLDEKNDQRESVYKQLHELQGNLLLFLKNIRRIEVAFYNDDAKQTSFTSLSIEDAAEANCVMLKETSIAGTVNAVPKEDFYHITKHPVKGLSKSQNREYSGDEASSRSFETSTIVLAFPLKPKDSEPIIAPQDVFAFLPMRPEGFNFIIQADWDTDANRQDIVTTSPRNNDLLRGIAEAFIKAVLQFCEHDTLQYCWMRYLPQKESVPAKKIFWNKLVTEIKDKIISTPVMRSRERGDLRLINELKYRLEIVNDDDNEPLLADLPIELYLSDRYSVEDRRLLKDFGIKVLDMFDVFRLVEQDLKLVSEGKSRIRGEDSDKKWHSRAAILLQLPFKKKIKNWQDRIDKVKQLDIIPLEDRRWVAAVDGPIYFPTVDGIPIPKDLDLQLVDSAAAENPERKKLFKCLGVNKAEVKEIRSKILAMYQAARHCEHVTLALSQEHLNFLYLTHNAVEEIKFSDQIQIYDKDGYMHRPSLFDLYLPDDHPYGPRALLGDDGFGADTDVYHIADAYLDDIPEKPPGLDLTWTEWLQQFVGIRRDLRLVNPEKSGLSPSCKWIAENRPNKFLGFLKHLWLVEGDLVLGSDKIRKELMNVNVSCVAGRTEKLPLTYLPLPNLQSYCKRFMEKDEFFPFIELPVNTVSEGSLEQWSFLTEFGVSVMDDLKFRLNVLRCCKLETFAHLTGNISRLVNLYLSIDASQQDAEDPIQGKKDIGIYFKSFKRVFVPEGNGKDAVWIEPDLCRWDAPDYVTEIYPLRARYITALAGLDISIDRLGFFFQKTLNIPDMSLDDIVVELRAIKESSSVKADVIRRLYQRLYEKLSIVSFDIEKIRDEFEEYSLVYVEQGGNSSWRKPSECLWSSSTRIEGRIAINGQYEDLKPFFVESLLVKPVDLKMVYDELLNLASRENVPVEEARDLLLVFNSHLFSEKTDLSPGRLLQRKIFPVRGPEGKASLRTARENFVIIDREGGCLGFRELLQTLDFSLTEICRLRPFITWAGLENRYLSKLVKEVSRVEGGVVQPISRIRRAVRMKAYGLLRIAASFNSPRYDTDPAGLYDLLYKATTLETEGISSRLVLEQDDLSNEIEISKSELHIVVENNSLIVYVPKDDNAQDVCFKSKLPRRMAGWFMTDPSTGKPGKIDDSLINAINAVLDCRIPAVDSILKEEGIPEINIPDRSKDDATTMVSYMPPSSHAPSSPVSSASSTSEPNSYATPFTDVDDYRVASFRSTPSDHSQRYSSVPPAEDLRYARLLNKVVSIARSTTFPEFDSSNMSVMSNDLLEGGDGFYGGKTSYSSNDWEHGRMIGAAGELFVYELLKSLKSTLVDFKFNLGDWQSRIREYVSVHADYTDLRNWDKKEASDIVYKDDSGAFTAFLIGKGYLSEANWKGKAPKYYIEVKSTTERCKTPLYMTDDQFERMRTSTNGPLGNQNQDVIYTIFRVYNLGKNTTAVKIYVDPEEHRRTKKLHFSTDGWSVVPSVDS